MKPETLRKIEALGDLYTIEYGDWALTVNHCLTEPTCPTAIIAPEYDKVKLGKLRAPTFRVDADTIEAAIEGVVNAAYATLVEGRPKPETVPWSQEGDKPENVRAFLDAKERTRAFWAEAEQEGGEG